MHDYLTAGAANGAPVVGGNCWISLNNHDINWWVAVATLAYIAASLGFAWGKDQRERYRAYRQL